MVVLMFAKFLEFTWHSVTRLLTFFGETWFLFTFFAEAKQGRQVQKVRMLVLPIKPTKTFIGED